MKSKNIKKSTKHTILSVTTRTLVFSLTTLMLAGPIVEPMAATLKAVQQSQNTMKTQTVANKTTATPKSTAVTNKCTATPKSTAVTNKCTTTPKSTAVANKCTTVKTQVATPAKTVTKFYEFKINPPKNGTYIDKRTGFKVTVNFVYEKGEAKKVTWSSNYPVYSVLVKGGEKGGNLFKHDAGLKSGTEVITPDNKGIGHGHATFYYCVSTTSPLGPTNSVVTEPTSSTTSTNSVATEPTSSTTSTNSVTTEPTISVVQPLTVTDITQTSGLVTGGDYVIVNGTGFQKGITATLGGVDAVVVNYFSDTQIRIAIPKGTAEGLVDLTVTNPDGQKATLTGAYTYLALPAVAAPTITSMSSTSGLTSGGEYVTVSGTGFQKGLTVKLGGLEAQIANFYSDTQIRIIIPKVTTPGVADLEIINPDGQKATLTGAYTYTVPVVALNSLSATNGDFNGGYYIFLNGVNFDPNSTVTVNNVPVSIYYYSSTQIKILSMPSASSLGLSNEGGVVPIKLTDSLGNSVTMDFTYNAKPAIAVPVITKFTGAGGAAATGTISGGTYMYFYGTGFTSTMKVRLYDPSNTLVQEDSLTNFYNSGSARYVMSKVTTAGNYTVKLVNEDGVESNGVIFVYK